MGNSCCSQCEEKHSNLHVLRLCNENTLKEAPETEDPDEIDEIDEKIEINKVELFFSKEVNLDVSFGCCNATDSPKQVPNTRLIKEKSDSGECVMSQMEELTQVVPGKYLEEKKDCVMPLNTKLEILTGFRAESDWQLSSGFKKVVDVRLHHLRRENKTELLNNYIVIEDIGKGAFGEVKKIEDRKSGQMRAMKVIPKEKCEATSTFAEEIKILQKLDHPNVLITLL